MTDIPPQLYEALAAVRRGQYYGGYPMPPGAPRIAPLGLPASMPNMQGAGSQISAMNPNMAFVANENMPGAEAPFLSQLGRAWTASTRLGASLPTIVQSFLGKKATPEQLGKALEEK